MVILIFILKKSEVDRLEQVKVEVLSQLKKYVESARFREKENLKGALIIFIGKNEYVVISC
ncbi:MAG: hypothetical protein KAX49_19590 [Halanaerobiales bacterium]|nr:hypothetical protein [Halanaerobiales bacterium]